MKIKRELAQIIVGALLLALFIEIGWLSPANTFWSNAFSGVVIYIASRILAFFFS